MLFCSFGFVEKTIHGIVDFRISICPKSLFKPVFARISIVFVGAKTSSGIQIEWDVLMKNMFFFCKKSGIQINSLLRQMDFKTTMQDSQFA